MESVGGEGNALVGEVPVYHHHCLSGHAGEDVSWKITSHTLEQNCRVGFFYGFFKISEERFSVLVQNVQSPVISLKVMDLLIFPNNADCNDAVLLAKPNHLFR